MDCKRVKKNLFYLVEDKLSAEERIPIEEHIKMCLSCSRLLEKFTHCWGVLQHQERIQPDPHLWVKLQRRLIDNNRDKNLVRGLLEGIIRRLRPAIAVAAVLLCIFLGHSLGTIPLSVNGQTTSSETVRLTTLQNFFENNYFNPLADLPTGSLEATYWNMMSQE